MLNQSAVISDQSTVEASLNLSIASEERGSASPENKRVGTLLPYHHNDKIIKDKIIVPFSVKHTHNFIYIM